MTRSSLSLSCRPVASGQKRRWLILHSFRSCNVLWQGGLLLTKSTGVPFNCAISRRVPTSKSEQVKGLLYCKQRQIAVVTLHVYQVYRTFEFNIQFCHTNYQTKLQVLKRLQVELSHNTATIRLTGIITIKVFFTSRSTSTIVNCQLEWQDAAYYSLSQSALQGKGEGGKYIQKYLEIAFTHKISMITVHWNLRSWHLSTKHYKVILYACAGVWQVTCRGVASGVWVWQAAC